MVWLYVPVEEDWNLPSDLHSETVTAASCTSREKYLQPQRWYQRWQRGGWIRLLSGMTLKPSQAMSLVRSWATLTFSQAAYPASPTVSQEGNGAKMTRETSGPTRQESSPRLGQMSFFSKMSQASWDITTNELGETLSEWATRLRRDYSARQKLAQAIYGNDCSYWPTPDASIGTGGWSFGTAMRKMAGLDRVSGAKIGTSLKWEPRFIVEYVLYGGNMNPMWIEWLMGWPTGWTNMNCSETEWFLWLLLMRSILSAEG